MQKIFRSLALGAILMSGLAISARPALADDDGGGIVKGCWFRPPNPPACDICADNCNPGQNCCVILHM